MRVYRSLVPISKRQLRASICERLDMGNDREDFDDDPDGVPLYEGTNG